MSENPGVPAKPASPAAATPAAAELSPEATKVLGQLKAIDPAGEGAGVHALRPFYPRVGWNKMLAWLNELVAAKLVTTSRVLNGKGGVAYLKYHVKS